MKNISRKLLLKKKLVIIAVVVFLGALGSGIYFFYQPSRPALDPKINYNPPTNNERQAGIDQKEKNKTRVELDENPPAITSANVLITDASQYGDDVEVRAYSDNVYEDVGTCVAVFTKGPLTVTKSNPAFKDAKTMQCGALDFKREQFTQTGTWQLVLTYRSPTAEGSASRPVEIQ